MTFRARSTIIQKIDSINPCLKAYEIPASESTPAPGYSLSFVAFSLRDLKVAATGASDLVAVAPRRHVCPVRHLTLLAILGKLISNDTHH